MENLKFNNLGLNEDILKAIEDMGFETPSKIQAEVIPIVLQGFDVIGQAQTGTGKTLAFGAPVLNSISNESKKVKSIILAPTRELAIQVYKELTTVAKYTKFKLLPVYGGDSIDRQIKSLKKGIDIVIGTPGRVQDLINRKALNLSHIEFLVLDEADEMLNMGFVDDIENILKSCNEDRRTLLFSATMPSEIKKIAKKYMKKDAKHVAIAQNSMTVSSVEQFYYEVKQKNKFESLCKVLSVDEPTRAIIFCKTKKGVDELVSSMKEKGFSAEGMHGDMTQSHRLNTLNRFKERTIPFLVATDVAARGIDVKDTSHVINYDLPQDTESYVHRIGRTGRANKKGTAYTFVTPKEFSSLKRIQKISKSKINKRQLPTMDDVLKAKFDSILNDVEQTLSKDNYNTFIPLVKDLESKFDLTNVTAALMSMLYNDEISYDYDDDNTESNSLDYTRIFLNVGRKDRLNPKILLEFLDNNANINKSQVGSIDILDKFAFVDIATDRVGDLMDNCIDKTLCRRKLNIEVAKKSK
ncbi:DEAD/DEAH box helicase [Clostridium tetani]|uniref:ATP-dependent RNA helicase CshA n=1 Tax=Clostridium tetani (strain Massachusetts / E88) TaxID=212717 RepID=Q892T9_CLOTE|nr:DEAD/DEAH box helicase [Clostridium tetani]AAO36505.1 ATP-dependent RNA helicase [Clostridium tetani E88]KGI38988.1 DEAD/DEAH box helicase [Clostridium tetani]KGI39446.1 DEAD/DEAH box helicase [Clostridium tetani ATCC 9441]KGI43557.1 DEAD/DEAH box helicase [Clostridium tetani]KGI44775.1 DEAD/DEAH box helicase [Clostridium tetani]